MSALSEVSLLLAQKATDIETAREIFKDEMSVFVGGLISALRRNRSDPWTSARIKLDLPREVESDAKATTRITDHFALGRVGVRFKKGTNFIQVAEIKFGLELEEPATTFNWRITFNLMSRYLRMDDLLWSALRTSKQLELPGQAHQEKTNTVVFVTRPINAELTAELAYADVKSAMEFVLSSDVPIAEAVGIDPGPTTGEIPSVKPAAV